MPNISNTIRGHLLEVVVHIAVVTVLLKARVEDEKIKRWLIVLQGYTLCIARHVRGTQNIADPLSKNLAINWEWDKLDDKKTKIYNERYVNVVFIDTPSIWWHSEVMRKVQENL